MVIIQHFVLECTKCHWIVCIFKWLNFMLREFHFHEKKNLFQACSPHHQDRESHRGGAQTSPPNAGLGVAPALQKHFAFVTLLLSFMSLPLPSFSGIKLLLFGLAKLCPTLCDPTDDSKPGLPGPPHLSEFVQVHVH